MNSPCGSSQLTHRLQRSGSRRIAWWRMVGWGLLPAALLLREAAFVSPETTERLYGRWVYPPIARLLTMINSWSPYSVAEVIIIVGLVVVLGWIGIRLRSVRRAAVAGNSAIESLDAVVATDRTSSMSQAMLGTALWVLEVAWTSVGLVLFVFLTSWGLNYARPPLEQRLGLEVAGVRSQEILSVGRVAAILANELYEEVVDVEGTTMLPMEFSRLTELLDESIDQLELPGIHVYAPTSPAKRLASSPVFSRLHISGIFVPFTGEPSINADIPDVSLPLAVAHEHAHQRGITDEGDANLVAFMACRVSGSAYLQYAAYLEVAARLIGVVTGELSREAHEAWELLGDGPRRDLQAVREFWDSFRGPTAHISRLVNDKYLRSLRVQDGIHSYDNVVRMLVALNRRGEFELTRH